MCSVFRLSTEPGQLHGGDGDPFALLCFSARVALLMMGSLPALRISALRQPDSSTHAVLMEAG
jgi:hypothetical protein